MGCEAGSNHDSAPVETQPWFPEVEKEMCASDSWDSASSRLSVPSAEVQTRGPGHGKREGGGGGGGDGHCQMEEEGFALWFLEGSAPWEFRGSDCYSVPN